MLIKFQTDWTKHFANIGDIAILNSLLCIRRDRRAVWKIVGRLSEVKLVTNCFGFKFTVNFRSEEYHSELRS